jgi:purine-binding chemotaxis protein CheW
MNAYPTPVPTDTVGEPGFHFESAEHCFIVFAGGGAFGLPVDRVQTIFQMEAVTAVPLGPREILGIVNLRGKIVTAVSLRRRLQMPELVSKKPRLAIGMEHRGENFALVVDEVGDVIVLDPKRLIPLPPHLDPQRTKLTESIYRLDSQILSLLNMESMFDFQRRN